MRTTKSCRAYTAQRKAIEKGFQIDLNEYQNERMSDDDESRKKEEEEVCVLKLL